MRYPIAIETGDAKHVFGVVVPDLPGCFSAGDSLDDALSNSREASLLHLEGLLDDGQPFPAPTPIEQLQKKRSYRGWTWAVVDVDASELGDKAARSTSHCRSAFYVRSTPMPGSRVRLDCVGLTMTWLTGKHLDLTYETRQGPMSFFRPCELGTSL